MKHVFTYGSLMFPAVWQRVVKGRYKSEYATLLGYERRKVRAEDYPALIPANGQEHANVEGKVYFNVSLTDLVLLDVFEGEQYQRVTRTLEIHGEKINIEVYLWRASFNCLLSPENWSPEEFKRRGMSNFIRRYRGF